MGREIVSPHIQTPAPSMPIITPAPVTVMSTTDDDSMETTDFETTDSPDSMETTDDSPDSMETTDDDDSMETTDASPDSMETTEDSPDSIETSDVVTVQPVVMMMTIWTMTMHLNQEVRVE